MQRRSLAVFERRLWLAVYVVLLLAPLVLLAAAPTLYADRVELFGIALGFVALSVIALQFVTPSRIPRLTASFGIAALLRLHRYMGYAALLIVVLHVTVFVLHDDQFLSWLYPVRGPVKAQAGWIALFSLVLLVVSSKWRRVLRLSYEQWRFTHIMLGLALVVGGTAHALLISWYSNVGPLRVYALTALAVAVCCVAYLRLARPMGTIGSPYLVTEVVAERGAATTLRLEAVGNRVTPFRPGQFAWIRAQGRPFSLTEHPFSYASSAHDPSRPSFTIKQLGDFTGEVAQMRPGSTVYLDGPHGEYEPQLPDAGFVLTVGGVGITAAMSFIRTCADVGDMRPITLIYGARTIADVTFLEELDELRQRMPLDVRIVLSEPDPGWDGPSGFIDRACLEQVLPHDAASRNHFICGPPIMVEGVVTALDSLGIPPVLVHAERFESV